MVKSSICIGSVSYTHLTIQGEFPDNSLDGKYIILTDKSFLPDEYKRKWKASDDEVKILVTDRCV